MLSYEEIKEISRPIVLRFLHQTHHLGSKQEAYSELMNIAYVVAREHPDKKSLRTWLVWTLADYVKAPTAVLTDRRKMYFTGEPDPAWVAERAELAERLQEAVKNLENFEAAVLHLYFDERRTHVEIGKAFNFSREWSRKEIKRILEKLRNLIEKG